MPEQFDIESLDLSKPEDLARLQEAYRRARSEGEEASKAVAEAAAKDRTRGVQDVLRKLNAPESVADVYPLDAKVDEDTIRSFLKDKIGMEPDKETDAWRRFESLQNKGTPPAASVDEMDTWAKAEMEKTEDFYRRQNKPTEQEENEVHALKAKITKKLAAWDSDVQSGTMDPIFSPQGFGGFLDPPSYARRARNFVSLQ